MSRLVITELCVESFCKFNRPHRLEGLGPGLNLLAAPNEAGKTTLKTALDAALFQRHRLTGAGASQYLNQWHEAPPAVRVTFDLDGASYTIAKRFYRQQKALLHRPDGTSVEGDAAERELQTLLGFQTPDRGGIKTELLGVWGLLWANQGDTIGPLAVSDSARHSLEECLAAGGVAAVTGGRRGNAVPAAIRKALGAFVTEKNRQPTGRYRQLLDEKAALEKAVADATTLQRELAEQTDALTATRRDLAAEQRGTDEEAERESIKALQARLTEARQLAAQVENARLSVSLARQEVTAAEKAAERRQEQIAEAARRADELQTASALASQTADDVATAVTALANAEREAGQAATAAKAAKAAVDRIARARGLRERQAMLARETERLHQALEAARAHQTLHRQAEALACTPEAIKRLRGLASEHATAAAAREAAATALRFRLSEEGVATARLDGEALAADAVVDLLQPAWLDLGQIGSVEIAPRVQDADALEQRLRKTEAALAEALAALGVASLTDAESQAEQRMALRAQAETARERAKTLIPDATGVGDLADRLQQAETEAEQARIALAEENIEAGESLDETEDKAKAALIEAEAAERATHHRLNEAQQTHGLARQAASHAADRKRSAASAHDTATKALEVARAAETDDALEKRIAAATQKLTAEEKAFAALSGKAEELGLPERIAAQLERAETARDRRRERIAKLKETIGRLEEQVRAASAKGPDEEVAEASENLRRVETEIARIGREKDALTLLDQVLSDAAREAEARYLAPLTQHLRPYLTELLGQAELELNNRLSPACLNRSGGQETFDQLSAGTQEQLSILTRLAFADVLAAQGRPAVLLLDDALLFCDDVRLESMFTALERAAERFQVIVFTCHARAFDGLGGKAQRRLAIEPAEAIAF